MRWIVKRILLLVLTVWTVITFTFFLVRVMPGSMVNLLMQEYILRGMSEEEASRQVEIFYSISLEKPIWLQYLDYIVNLARGDLGVSLIFVGTPVITIITHALPWTVFLISLSLITSFVLGVTLGMLMAYRRATILDRIASLYASISHAVPNYVIALMLLLVFAAELKLFPVKGAYDITIEPGFTLEFISNVLYHTALPFLAYVISSVGGWMLTMKSSAISVLGEDYVMAAEARGLHKRRIMLSYVARNAILPLFTSLAISIGYIFGGAVFIETIFNYPGMGYYFSVSVGSRDYPLMQGFFLLMTLAVVLANLIADVLYSRLDPRIKVGE